MERTRSRITANAARINKNYIVQLRKTYAKMIL